MTILAAQNSLATGFFVTSKCLIVTNHHVVKDSSQFSIYTSKGELLSGFHVIYSNKQSDIALLEKPFFNSCDYLQIADGNIEIGEEIYLLGNPEGNLWTITNGIISNNVTNKKGVDTLLITAPALKGSSGSPIINSTGNVLGVLHSIHPSRQGFSIGSSKLEIKKGMDNISLALPRKTTVAKKKTKGLIPIGTWKIARNNYEITIPSYLSLLKRSQITPHSYHKNLFEFKQHMPNFEYYATTFDKPITSADAEIINGKLGKVFVGINIIKESPVNTVDPTLMKIHQIAAELKSIQLKLKEYHLYDISSEIINRNTAPLAVAIDIISKQRVYIRKLLVLPYLSESVVITVFYNKKTDIDFLTNEILQHFKASNRDFIKIKTKKQTHRWLNVVIQLIPAMLASLPLMIGYFGLFRKTKVCHPLLGFIPFVNFAYLLDIIGLPRWWLFLLLIPWLNIFFLIYLHARLGFLFNRNSFFIMGLLIVPWIFLPIIGFDRTESSTTY